QPDRIVRTTDRKRMDFIRRLALSDRWTNIQHMSTEDPAALSQIVGVVLHERRSALETVTHDLHGPHKRRRFPVAFRAESISIGHQTLHGDSWKLRQAVQVLKRVGECLGASVLKKIPQPQLNSCGLIQGGPP